MVQLIKDGVAECKDEHAHVDVKTMVSKHGDDILPDACNLLWDEAKLKTGNYDKHLCTHCVIAAYTKWTEQQQNKAKASMG